MNAVMVRRYRRRMRTLTYQGNDNVNKQGHSDSVPMNKGKIDLYEHPLYRLYNEGSRVFMIILISFASSFENMPSIENRTSRRRDESTSY